MRRPCAAPPPLVVFAFAEAGADVDAAVSRVSVPLFSIDPDHPGCVVRRLDGKVERGVLENGEFKVVE